MKALTSVFEKIRSDYESGRVVRKSEPHQRQIDHELFLRDVVGYSRRDWMDRGMDLVYRCPEKTLVVADLFIKQGILKSDKGVLVFVKTYFRMK